jgi:acetate---CoA ligase (ADP-forming) subunit alpha
MMIGAIDASPLYRIANPRSIAVWGASNRLSSMGTLLLGSMQEDGYTGAIYPVHPREQTVRGLKAYTDVADLPETPDLAVIVLPTAAVCEVLEACGRKGIRQAVIVSGGFKEIGGDGIVLEQRLAAIAERYRIKLLGPNCLGSANPHINLNMTPLPNFGRAGYVGLASQSGSFIAQMYDYLDRFGLGFSTAFSVGNQLNTDLIDCLEYLGACPQTRVIALYIESINRGRAFIEAARAIVPHKPVVALYVGGSESGRRAAFSHTGSMSGPDDLYEAVFRQCGIIRAQTVSELFDFCWVLGSQPCPTGNRLAILTHSGGPGAAAADISCRVGLSLPGFSEETRRQLAPFIPNTGNVNNPIDLTFTKDPQDFFLSIPRILLADPGIDMLMIYFLMPVDIMRRRMAELGLTEEQIAAYLEEMVRKNGETATTLRDTFSKPVVGFTYRSLREVLVRGIIENELPVFPNPERAARSLAALVQYHRRPKA